MLLALYPFLKRFNGYFFKTKLTYNVLKPSLFFTIAELKGLQLFFLLKKLVQKFK